MTLTETERMLEAGVTSERVSFTCSGCGVDTVVHVGLSTRLLEKRCMKCRGTSRTGRDTVTAQRATVGTHKGSLKTKERRDIKRAASARNRQRRPGLKAKNGTTYRAPCRSYDECNHRKHRVAQGRR